MIAMTEKQRWLARRREVRGKNRAVLLVLVSLAALFYFIALVRMGAPS
jgi:hypothetical protein